MKLLLSFLSFLPLLANAQIQGYVTDGSTHLPLENVVVIAGNDTTITDKNGNFKLDVNSDTLIFGHIGYEDKTFIRPNENKLLAVMLQAEPETLPELNITINPFNDPLKRSPGSSQVLTINTNQKQTYLSSADLLNRVPGIYVQQGTLNTNRVTIRGIGSRTPYSTNRIKAYFGDIPLTTGDGVSVIEDLDLNGIGRIEIIKGPSSAIYGSGLGGVLRILPSSKQQNGISFQSSAGSFNTFRHSTNVDYSGGKFSINGNYSNVMSKGFRENNTYSRHNVYLGSGFHTGNTHISLNAIYTRLKAQIPSSLSLADFNSNPENAAANWLAVKGYENYKKFIGGITATTFIGKNWTNKVSLYGGAFNQYESRPFDILDDQSSFWGLRERLIYKHEKLKALLGMEYYGEQYSYDLYYTRDGEPNGFKNANREMRQYINVFTSVSYDILKNLNVNAGLNLNRLNYHLFDQYPEDYTDISGVYSFDPIVSPRLGLLYNAGKSVSLHASAGHGFSHPSLEETLLPQGTINPDLKPEQGYNLEAGIRLNFFQNLTYAELTVYRMYLNNLLVIRRETEDVFYAENAGSTEHQGIEFSLHQTILKQDNGWQINYSASATLSDHYFTDFTSDNVIYDGNKLPGIPSYTIYNQVSANRKERLMLSADWFISGSQYLNDANSGKTNGFSVINAKLSIVLHQQMRFKITIFGGVKNIMNSRYASMVLVNAPSFNGSEPRYYYPGQPRYTQAGVRLSF